MARLKRTGRANRLIVRNSKVYASTLNAGAMNGLFAFRAIKQGEILVQYEGEILSQRAANKSTSEYLFTAFYRSRKDADTVVEKVIDGASPWTHLAAYANHAPSQFANAEAVDILPSIIDNDIPYAGRHALVLVAKRDIALGQEIRFDYNSNEPEGEGVMTKMMMRKHGLTLAQINDKTWLTTRWVTPPERNWAGIVEDDFMYRFVSEI